MNHIPYITCYKCNANNYSEFSATLLSVFNFI
jgi:hypothetical protein